MQGLLPVVSSTCSLVTCWVGWIAGCSVFCLLSDVSGCLVLVSLASISCLVMHVDSYYSG